MTISNSELNDKVLWVALTTFRDNPFQRRPLMLAAEKHLREAGVWTEADDVPSQSADGKTEGLAKIDWSITHLKERGKLENRGWDDWKVATSQLAPLFAVPHAEASQPSPPMSDILSEFKLLQARVEKLSQALVDFHRSSVLQELRLVQAMQKLEDYVRSHAVELARTNVSTAADVARMEASDILGDIKSQRNPSVEERLAALQALIARRWAVTKLLVVLVALLAVLIVYLLVRG